jgi:hypothetical protein
MHRTIFEQNYTNSYTTSRVIEIILINTIQFKALSRQFERQTIGGSKGGFEGFKPPPPSTSAAISYYREIMPVLKPAQE